MNRMLKGILIQKFVGMATEHPEEFKKRVAPAILIPLGGLVFAMLAFYFGLKPETLERLVEGADSPYAVIAAYDKWYGILAAVSRIGMVLVVVCGVAAFFIGRKSAAAAACAIILSLISFLICVVMSVGEDIPALRAEAQEDMAQIENARLESAEIYFHKEKGRSGLPGPDTKGQPVMFTIYSGIGEAVGQRWMNFYIPDSLGFTPDSERMYDDNKSIDWNNRNARLYSITYTKNFHVVMSVESVN